VFLTAKTLLCAALIALISVSASAFRNEPDGYGGIAWGTSISAVKGMKRVGARPGFPDRKIYVRPGDALRFGHVDLKGIEYEFLRGKFRSAPVYVNDHSRIKALKKEAFRRFGHGRELHPFAERYFWEGEISKIYLISAFDLS